MAKVAADYEKEVRWKLKGIGEGIWGNLSWGIGVDEGDVESSRCLSQRSRCGWVDLVAWRRMATRGEILVSIKLDHCKSPENLRDGGWALALRGAQNASWVRPLNTCQASGRFNLSGIKSGREQLSHCSESAEDLWDILGIIRSRTAVLSITPYLWSFPVCCSSFQPEQRE